MANEPEINEQLPEQKYTLTHFLEQVPPGRSVLVVDFSHTSKDGFTATVSTPELRLHCQSPECSGLRFFAQTQPISLNATVCDRFIEYRCRNCGKSVKTYALGAISKGGRVWSVRKYGELPAFGPPTPARAITLIGGERELFLLGRRCENQDMGIGAFVYYRRVIESQKNRIFSELIKVVSALSPGDPVLGELELAKQETQFTTSVDKIKHALPSSLFINGYNPLTLLHSALSEGVHQNTDPQCLELASSVRTVLFEFAERLGQAWNEDRELKAAVNKLTNKK